MQGLDRTKKLDRLTDPLVPSKISDFIEIFHSLNLDIDEEFMIDLISDDEIVPVGAHPLHQKKVLALAEEFYRAGFLKVGGFLLDELLKAPNLKSGFCDEATFLKKKYMRR